MVSFRQATTRAKAAIAALRGHSGVPSVTGRGLAHTELLNWVARRFSVSYERRAVHDDMHRMDKTDEIVSFALDAIASRTLGYEDPTVDAFTLLVRPRNGATAQSATRAQEEINALIDRCNLRAEAWQVIRRAAKWGNEFRELLIDWQTGEVGGLKLLPEHTVWPRMDDRGNRQPGYQQVGPEGSAAVEFEDWELLHFAFGELDGYLGTPLLRSARRNWKRLNLAEDMTAGARLIRAFMKIIHKVPVQSDWSPEEQSKAIEMYKNRMTQRNIFDQDTGALEHEPWPQTVYTDFYVPDDGSNRGGVEMLDPENAQLQNIRDIEHFCDRLITATRVPKRYYPFEGGTPKLSEGGGQAEDKHFACLLMMCQMMLKQGYESLFNTQLRLKGIDPASVRYVWRMAKINTVDQLRAAQTDLAKARAFEVIAAKYPEMLEYVDVVLREWTSVSDTSAEVLSAIEPPDAEAGEDEESAGNGRRGGRARIQLPGTGVGPETRSQV